VLRVYSWVFEAVLCAMAIAVAAVTVLSGDLDLKLGWLPWDAKTITAWLFGFGVLGLLLILLAIAGRLRILLFLLALAVFVLLVKGFFYGLGYSFENAGQARNALILIGGAFVAWLGAWPWGGHRRTVRH
jgi:hypothetical protein